ncbi:MAG: cell division protein FtsQ/DivIB [Eubacterium sp.]
MKKKDGKKKVNRVTSDFDSLNTELGSSFGLEPPKRYRSDQRLDNSEPEKKRKSGTKKPNNRTTKKQLSKQEQIKQRKKRNKLRKVLSVAGVLLAIAIVVLILSLTVFFKIDTINVTGTKKYSDKQVMAVLPFENNDNLFLIDKDGTAERLEKNLPYIYNVEITRKLPSTVNIKITEPTRVLTVRNSDKTYTVLDDNLKVLEQSSKSKPKNSISVKKATLKSAVVGETAVFSKNSTNKCIAALLTVIKEVNLAEATGIYTNGPDSNYIVYDNRITIKLGSTSDLENKLYSALAAIDKLNKTNPTVKGEIAAFGGKQVYFTEKK